MIIFSICSVLSGLATGFWTLLATRVVMGAVEGPFLPIVLAIITSIAPAQRRGLYTGIVQNVFGSLLGNALAPKVVVAIAIAWGWRTSFFVAGLPGLILLLLVWRYIDEPPRMPKPANDEPSAPGSGIIAMLRERNIALCAIISCVMIGSLVLGSIFLPLYLTQVRGYSPSTMSSIMAALGFTPAVGGILVTWISDRIGRRLPMILFAMLTALCPLAALYFDGPVWTLTALMFVGWIGIGMYPLFMGVVPAETLNFRNVAAAMGLVVAIGELTGGVCGPLVAGWLADMTSLRTPLLISAGMSLCGGIVSLFIIETNPAILARRTAVTA
jgi:predicted MFS family arabinose efflux permease